jgi:MoaA/NifB/PqqE/SkfB family radical SAM enzyme
MGLLAITTMSKLFNHYDVKIVHLEPTDVCNAACPLCARETDTTFDKNQQHHLTVDQVAKIFSAGDIKNLNKMFMCGNYGDPAAANYCLELFKYFRSHNPNIVLGMNTNGSLRNTKWWEKLADILTQPQDYVVFSIDGLEDTNHVYRINTVWEKIIENAQAFINNGGRAHWEMLVYHHNEHQVDDATALAEKLGFKWFRAKVSKRRLANELKYPVFWPSRSTNKSGEIKCMALGENSIFVSATGKVSPCCWLGEKKVGIESFDSISKSWATHNPHAVCNSICRTFTPDSTVNTFKNQWQLSVEFK